MTPHSQIGKMGYPSNSSCLGYRPITHDGSTLKRRRRRTSFADEVGLNHQMRRATVPLWRLRSMCLSMWKADVPRLSEPGAKRTWGWVLGVHRAPRGFSPLPRGSDSFLNHDAQVFQEPAKSQSSRRQGSRHLSSRCATASLQSLPSGRRSEPVIRKSRRVFPRCLSGTRSSAS